jgi:hypothetical protein
VAEGERVAGRPILAQLVVAVVVVPLVVVAEVVVTMVGGVEEEEVGVVIMVVEAEEEDVEDVKHCSKMSEALVACLVPTPRVRPWSHLIDACSY